MTEQSPRLPEPPNILAWVALACSIGLCPIASLAGVLLGLRSLIVIHARGSRRGRRVAMAAVAIGVVVLAGWVSVATLWHFTFRVPALNGPKQELQAAFSGDVQKLIDGFGMNATSESEEIVQDFIDELRNRYGGLVDINQREFAESTQVVQNGQMLFPPVIVIGYDFQFERARVPAIGHLARQRGMIFRWRALIVRDEVLGDLYFPSEAAAELDEASAEALHGQ